MSTCQQHQQQHHFFVSVDVHDDQEQERYDPLANLLSLQLRKPAHWNLELNTSRSCSNIALPRILLYDQKGVLILDADGPEEQSYRPTTATTTNCRKLNTTPYQTPISNEARLSNNFQDLGIGMAMPRSRPTPITSPKRQQLTESCIDFSTHELPDWQANDAISSRRFTSLRGISSKDQEQRQERSYERTLDYPTPPTTSTSTLSTTANLLSSGPQETRRYRRTQSIGQHSILERLSWSRGRISTPEYVHEQIVEHGPQYFLRSSNAGTLVIKDESFSHGRPRRRRYRHAASENSVIQHERSPSESSVQVSSKRQFLQRGRESVHSISEDEAKIPITRKLRCQRNHRKCFKDVVWEVSFTIFN